MIEGIKAVAFDIDGTLYADWRLFVRLPLYFLRHLRFFLRFQAVRKQMHRTAPLADFYEYQARLLAEKLRCSPEEAKSKITDICYEGLKPYFTRIKTYPDVYATICAIKNAGYKVALLSDFPPEQKGRVWGIRSLCDVCIGSEESGALKPSIYPFGILARKLGVGEGEILYVGNSVKYDVRGANNAGLKSAYLMKGLRALLNIPLKEADVSFASYRQLRRILLGNAPK